MTTTAQAERRPSTPDRRTTMSTAPTATPPDDVLSLAARIFALRYEAGYSFGAVTQALRDDGHSISQETVRKIIRGETHGQVTEGLRRRYPAYTSRVVEELGPDDYTAIFVGFHREKRSLAQIANDYEGFDYNRVRRVLVGEGEYAEPTYGLRVSFPPYRQQTGRGARQTPTPETIQSVFVTYFANEASLEETRRLTGVPKGQIKALITGREAPELTRELRAKYGDTLRSPGPSSGPRWHQARGVDPAPVG